MKIQLLASVMLIVSTGAAQAQGPDIIGGPGVDSAQTLHHCGYLPTGSGMGFGFASYTNSALTTRIVQQKLADQGYYHAAIDGKYGPASKASVRALQADYNLPVTGAVDGQTASILAYASHPAANVQRCYRQASNSFR